MRTNREMKTIHKGTKEWVLGGNKLTFNENLRLNLTF